ncbi:MAG: serine/threonine protein kinase [Scytolyngbya sp. HA4215-MV1]|jgi:WD40 repeat protein|nr:serine/threonine protein kinase [Scytolyngbya sp. HA4215-MV1]
MSYCLNPNCQEPQNPDVVDCCQACGSFLRLQNRYRPMRLIGQGGFGRTFLAIDEGGSQEPGAKSQELSSEESLHPKFQAASIASSSSLPDRLCVIKQLLPHNQIPDVLARSTQRFQQEAQQLAELGNHPQIPCLLAFFEENQILYLVQEWIAGTSLATELAEQGAFSETQIWQVLTDLLPVLKFMHDHQVIHRDIKPANIIRRSASSSQHQNELLRSSVPADLQLPTPDLPMEPGSLVLVDFGAAKRVQAIDLVKPGTSIGSAEYVAPEQLRGKAVFASDLYSLGVTCIHLLTQLSPFDLFDGVNHCWIWRKLLTERQAKIGNATVSNALAEILDQLIESALSRRFQSADAVIQAISILNWDAHFSEKATEAPVHPRQLWQCVASLTGNRIASIYAIAMGSKSPSTTGEILVSGREDTTLQVWDLLTRTHRYTLSGHSQAVRSMALHPAGDLLASGSDDKTIRLWNIQTQAPISQLCGHTHTVRSVAFHPAGHLLASGSWDKTIRLWDVESAQVCCILNGHGLQVTAVTFSPDGRFLASASFDRTVRLWDLTQLTAAGHPSLGYVLSGHTWSVLAVAFSPDGTLLASGGDDRTIRLWDVATGELRHQIQGHSWAVTALTFSPDGEWLVSGSMDHTVKLWQVKTGKELSKLIGHTDSVHAVAINAPGETIVSASKDGTIKLWQSTL